MPTWGGLLEDATKRNVKVRLLAWFGFIGSMATKNLPGVYAMETKNLSGIYDFLPGTANNDRQKYNADWWINNRNVRSSVLNKELPAIEVRTRDGKAGDVEKTLKNEKEKRTYVEDKGLKYLATHHQKTILIDYEDHDGINAVGYVMGLNSVTDYWDTQEHLYEDDRRGLSREGDGDKDYRTLKPYQDYACRVKGKALIAVYRNFAQAWNKAKPSGSKAGSIAEELQPAKLDSFDKKLKRMRTLVVRTSPGDNDQSVKALYLHATSQAHSYIYLENQYFQYQPWVESLIEGRKKHKAEYQAAKPESDATAKTPNALYLMIVIPAPELEGMMPRTYDMLTALGHGSSMPNQDKEIKKQIEEGEKNDLVITAKQAQGLNKLINAENIQSMVAQLYTYDKTIPPASLQQKHYREIYIHSKLMIIDDGFFTVGSANLNERSMAADSEINIASDSPYFGQELRRRVWGLHTGGKLNGGCGTRPELENTFEEWKYLAQNNRDNIKSTRSLDGFLTAFLDERGYTSTRVM